MKASELIQLLYTAMHKDGDLEVMVFDAVEAFEGDLADGICTAEKDGKKYFVITS